MERGLYLVPGVTKRGTEPMKARLSTFLRDESAATAIEYALIAAGIAIAIITAVNGVGSALTTSFNTVSSSLK